MRRGHEAFRESQLSLISSALEECSEQLVAEGIREEDALMIAATELDGAAEGLTVLSPATCSELGGKRVRGLTGPDSITERLDVFAESELTRHRRADQNRDAAARWLRRKEKELRQLGEDVAVAGSGLEVPVVGGQGH